MDKDIGSYFFSLYLILTSLSLLGNENKMTVGVWTDGNQNGKMKCGSEGICKYVEKKGRKRGSTDSPRQPFRLHPLFFYTKRNCALRKSKCAYFHTHTVVAYISLFYSSKSGVYYYYVYIHTTMCPAVSTLEKIK